MAFPDSFSTARLNAERLEARHFPDLRRLHGDAEMMAYLGGVRDADQTAAYLERNLAHWSNYNFGVWILRETGRMDVAGLAVLRHLLVDEADEVEVGYGFLSGFWGHGLATEIATACLEFARQQLRLSSIVAVTKPANVASHRVLRKVGLELEREFVLEGVPNLLFRTNG